MTEHRTILACPGCGSVDIDVTGSDEVVLESISMIDTEPGHAGDEERAGNLSGPLLVVGARTTG
jgi:hypothetical protein